MKEESLLTLFDRNECTFYSWLEQEEEENQKLTTDYSLL